MTKVADDMRLPSTPVTMEEIADRLDAIHSKITTHVPRVLDIEATEASVSGSTTETALYTYTIPANTITTDQQVRLTAWGYSHTTGGAGTNSVTYRVKLNGNTCGTQILTIDGNNHAWRLFSIIQGDDSSSAQNIYTQFHIGDSDSWDNFATLTVIDDTFIGTCDQTVDMTSARDLVLSFQHSNANAACETALRGAFVELL